MDPGNLEYYEFLDLSDIDETERRQLKQTLYSDGTPDFLQLPWQSEIVQEEWQKVEYGDDEPQQPQHHIVPNGPLVPASSSPNMVAPNLPPPPQHNHPPVTMYSQPPPYTVPSTAYHNPQNVFVSNVTANVHHGYVGHYVQPHYNMAAAAEQEMAGRGGRRSRGRGNKRGDARLEGQVLEGNAGPGGYTNQPSFVPIHYHPGYYTQPPPMQHPNAQHATGSPLYIAPVYTHMYPPGAYGQYYPGAPHPVIDDQPMIDEPVIYQHDYDNVVDQTVIVNNMDQQQQQQPNTELNCDNCIPFMNQTVEVQTIEIKPETIPNTVPSIPEVQNLPIIPQIPQPTTQIPPLIPQIPTPQPPRPSPQIPLPTTAIVPTPISPTPPDLPEPKLIPKPPQLEVKIIPVEQKPSPKLKVQSPEPKSIPHHHVEPKTATAPEPTKSVPKLNRKVTKPEPKHEPEIVNSVAELTVVSSESVHKTSDKKTESDETVLPPPPPPGKSWASLFISKSHSNFAAAQPSPASVTATTIAGPEPGIPKTTAPKPHASMPRTMDDEAQTENRQGKKIDVSRPSQFTNDPNSHRMGEFLSKYTLDNRTVSVQPRGLTNRSNYCYINSILQALLACPPFYNLLKALPYQPRKNPNAKSPTPIIDSMIEFVNEFTPLSADARLNRKEKGQRKDNMDVFCGTSFEPSRIYKILNGIRTDTFIVEGRQEDAEEFFGCLLNALNDEMLELVKLVDDGQNHSGSLINGDIVTTNGETHDSDEVEWKVMGSKNKSSVTRRADFGRTPISDIFRGQLRSRVHRTGDQVTDNVQPFFTLQLDIEKASNVYEALEMLINKDKLEGVTCPKTNQQVEAWQQVTLEELPLVMVLHLKCFNYKLDVCSKIIKALDFPIDLKIDSKLLSSKAKYSGKQKQYKLFAVVYHDGKEASKGHYLTDAFHVGFGSWVRYDDSVVKYVQEQHVLHPNAARVPYLLYYRRCDTIGNQSAPSTTGGGAGLKKE